MSCLKIVILLALSAGVRGAQQGASVAFTNPERVTIEGYSGDVMEPFVTRDGAFLFFNNLNEPRVDTNLYWAQRIDDLRYRYRGELLGVNTSALDAVASIDRQGEFFFVSTRSYKQTASTVYQGTFSGGGVGAVHLVPQLSLAKAGIVNFDAEISADGRTLYYGESQFGLFGGPKWARILLARRTAGGFTRDGASVRLLAMVNGEGLNYAPATTASELQIFFTRALPGQLPGIYMAERGSAGVPFGAPVRIAAITGFAEAPTLSADERSLYYHMKENGHFVLYRVTRPAR